MADDNRIVLQVWYGETPDGERLEKNSFQIFIEGELVCQRRGEGISRELIGFVSKQPGRPINFLPVVDAFRDLIPHFEVQVRTALLDLAVAKDQAARAKVAELQSSVDAAGSGLVKLFAEDALKSAAATAHAAAEALEIERTVLRTSSAPDEAAIEQLKNDLKKLVDDADAGDSSGAEADQQNL